ncbi:MAG: DUF2807 domain-containing protein [Mucinivorans sp.]
MRKLFLLLLVALPLMAAGQEKLEIAASFHSIDVRGNVSVKIIANAEGDSATHASLMLDGLKLSEVKCEVKNGCLNVDVERGLLDKKGEVKLEIHTSGLKMIASNGATIKNDGCLASQDLTIETMGASNTITLNVEVKNLIVNSSGASDVQLTGRVDGAMLNSRLSSRIDMLHCVTTNAYCRVSEASEIYVFPLDLLDAKATTMGTVYYMGAPTLRGKSTLWGGIISLDQYAGKDL